jgi:ATP adenylyltransferase
LCRFNQTSSLDQVERRQLVTEAVHEKDVGVNCGEAAGQTVMPAHIHLIPRRKADTPKSRGGVRSVIPNRDDY